MNEFWDIVFDTEKDLLLENLSEGLLKLGFKKQSDNLFTKQIVNLHGEVVDDGIFVDLEKLTLFYYPEPDAKIQISLQDKDIQTVDNFLRNNII
jgi:hypothetical protein